MIGYKISIVFVIVSIVAVYVSSRASLHGPGHHKGLYGITRKPKPKTAVVNKNSTRNATSSSKSAFKSMEKKNDHSGKVDLKVVKRATWKEQDPTLQKEVSNRRTNIEIVGGVIKPISLKETEVGYIDDPKHSTQVTERTENMTTLNSVLEDGTGLDKNSPRSSNMLTDVNVPKLNQASDGSNGTNSEGAKGAKLSEEGGATIDRYLSARTPTSNIITDLKVPNMGQYIHGSVSDNNSSNGTNATQSSGGNTTADSGNSVTSRSPQVPNLGASIVGIADSSNISQFINRGVPSHNAAGEGVQQASPESDGMKLRAFLDDLDEIAHSTEGTTRVLNNTLQDTNSSVQNQTPLNTTSSSAGAQKDVKGNKKHEIIGPHYYEPECDDKKKCPDGHYCRMYVCVECHRSKHACTHREQCCNDMECVYGRCESKPKGSPGAFCEKDSECVGEACCVLEPTVDEEHSLCKPKLSEFHQCSPVLYRKIWIGDNKPDCGPCKGGLKCVQRGVEGSHEVCMKKP